METLSKTLRVCLALTALLFVPALALGGGDSSSCGFAGTQAVQFSVAGYLTLGEFQGQMFSYRRFLTNDRALRLAAGLSLDYNDSEAEIDYYGGDASGTADLSSWAHSGTVKIQMVFYGGSGSVRPYWGLGPKVTYADSHSEMADYIPVNDELQFILFVGDTDRWSLGLQGFAGVEWFINKTFSLHAEYGVSGMYYFVDSVDERLYSHSPELNRRVSTKVGSPQFDSDGVLFGLSARF